jgi:hypothetical protein
MMIWTLSRSLCMPGTHRKVCPKCAHRVLKRRRANMKTAIYLSKHRHGIGAGGGTRTLKLSRARAPKTRAVASFATPALPCDRTVPPVARSVGGVS